MEYAVAIVDKAEEQITVPARTEYPDVRYDLKDPIMKDDKIEIVIRKNGEDLDVLSFAQDHDVTKDNEARSYVKLVVAEMVAFIAPMDEARVISSTGTVSAKPAVIKLP